MAQIGQLKINTFQMQEKNASHENEIKRGHKSERIILQTWIEV